MAESPGLEGTISPHKHKAKELCSLDDGNRLLGRECVEPEMEPDSPHEWDQLLPSPSQDSPSQGSNRCGSEPGFASETKHGWVTAAALAANRVGRSARGGDASACGSATGGGAQGPLANALMFVSGLRAFMAVLLTAVFFHDDDQSLGSQACRRYKQLPLRVCHSDAIAGIVQDADC